MRKTGLIFMSLLLLISFVIVGCTRPGPEEMTPKPEPSSDAGKAAFIITSSAFTTGAEIPIKYTCDGENVSPPLDWGQVPVGTASFALIVDDPDAPLKTFTHWIVFNLPPDAGGLPEAVPTDGKLTSGALQGKNGFGKIGYASPCPPSGTPHHYRFTLYVLDESLNLAAGASKEQVLGVCKGI
jgi:Raf kinase inhibitor-like YbhB/YbcL family protein